MLVHPLYLLIGFVVGLVLTYLIKPEQQEIIKYPTPENAGKVVYKDSGGICYIYRAKQINCPEDGTDVEKIKVQHYIKKEPNGLIGLLGLKS